MSRTESTAMRLATSPASAPPMPSETTSTRPFLAQLKTAQVLRGIVAVRPGPRLLFGEFEDEKVVLVSAANTTDIRFCVQLNNHN